MALSLVTSITKLPPWMLLGVGVVSGYLKSLWAWLYDHTIGWLITKISVSITVEEFEHTDAYNWLAFWAEKHLRARNVSTLLLRQKTYRTGSGDLQNDEFRGGCDFDLMPHYGAYHMMWKRRYPMFIVHLKEKEALAAPVRRSLTITIWGKRDRNILYKMLDEARQEFDDSHPEKTQFYVTRYETWHKLTNVGERKIDTLYLPERMMADLLADVGGFLASREKYTRIGIPYRLGLLFEGPPGTGKTSLVQGLATHFSIPIYSLVISASSSGDDIAVAIARTRNPSILLFEDIDTLSVVRARKPSQKNVPESRGSSITLTDLLNVLDGIGAGENRIVIMTTNHPENLDPALVRSGRIDRKFHIGYAEDTELRRFYNVVSEEFPFPPWEEFRKSLPAKATIADAQSFALRGSITTSA